MDAKSHTKTAIGVMVLLFVTCGLGIAWCLYLECGPNPYDVRWFMHVALFVTLLLESLMCFSQQLLWWMLPVFAFFSLWGGLDAVLRYPVVHGFGTGFAWKHVGILVVRTVAYVCSLRSFTESQFYFCFTLILNVICFPMMYLLALPIEEVTSEQSSAARMVVDTDILIRLWRMLSDPQERQAAVLDCRRRARVVAAKAASRSPMASRVLCQMDPELKRVLCKTGRDV